MTTDEKLDLLINEVQSMKTEIHNVEAEVQSMKTEMQSMKQVQLKTDITLENIVDKCIQVLGEGYQLNAERFDKLDFESVKTTADQAFMLSKLTNEKVDRFIEKMNKSA